MNRTYAILLACSAGLGALSATTLATAADVKSPASQGADSAVSEVVVTAQKRSERLQDVPLAVTAVSGKSLETQGVTSIDDLAARTPGIHISKDSTQSSFTVRGISSSTSGDTTSATAGLYVDDYPLYDTWFRFASPSLHLFDINQVEVLRGPQGTLYGATSLSGSIRILTNKPNLQSASAAFEATGSDTSHGGGNYALNAMVNVPIVTDKLAMRAVVYSTDDSGWIDNPVRGQSDVNENRSIGGRLQLRARPTDDWTLNASLTLQRDDAADQNATYYAPPAGADAYDFNSRLPTKIRTTFFLAALSAERRLGHGDLTLTYDYGENRSRNVGDGTPISIALGTNVDTPFYQPSNSDTNILEARYVSEAVGPFRYIVGAYLNTRYRAFRQDATQPALPAFFGTPVIYDVYANQRSTEAAVYGEGNWDFAPGWEATVGLRVFNNSYHFNSQVSGLLNSFTAPTSVNPTDIGTNDTSATPRFSLSYKPQRNINIYATVSEGYRFGLTNYNSGATPGIPLAYKPDSLWNYELGLKTTMLNGRLTFNSALYYEDWRDIQISFRNTNGQVYVTNAGDARSYGWENEISFRPTPAWEFNGALSLGRAELTTDNPGVQRLAASARGPAVFGVMKGDELPGSQNVNGSFGVQYNIANIWNGSAYLRVDDVYVGKSCVDFTCEGSLKIGDYSLVNLRASYKIRNYEFVAFADNVFDSDGVVNAIPDVDITGLTDAAYRVRPRTFGLTVRAKY